MDNLFLKYGDLVFIYSGQNKKNNQLSQGFLSTTGYLNESIYLQSNQNKGINILEEMNQIRNIRDMIFKVVPKLNYEFHKSYKSTYNTYEYLKKLTHSDKKNLKNNSSDILVSLKLKLERLKTRKKKEFEINQSIIKESEGKNVLYGADIQLMHYDSNMFLEGIGECAPSKEIGYIIKLSNLFSENMIFRFLPKFKAMCEGKEIQYEDHIIIYSVNLETNLKFDYEEKCNKENEIGPSSYNPIRPYHTHFDKNTELYRTLLGRTDFHWQILFCGNFIKNIAQGLSLSYITHCESNKSIIIKQNKGYINIDNSSNTLGIFEISLLDSQKIIKNIKYGDSIILKQFFTGLNLSYNEFNDIEGNTNISDNSIFNLESITSNSNFFLAFFIKNKNKQIVVDNYFKNNTIDYDYDKNIFYPLEKELLNEKLMKLILKKDESFENSFKFELVSEELKWEILFIKSAFPILKKFIFSWENNKKYKIPDEIISQFTKKIKLLVEFLYIKNFSSSKKREIEPIERRQKLFFESHLLDLLIDCIYLPFKKGFINIQNLNKYSFLGQALTECHITLRESIKEYRPGELASSQWFSIFLNQTLKTNDFNDIGAGSTLTELIDNNENILKYRIKEDIIKNFTNYLIEKEKDKRFIEIIKALCVCNNKAIKKNQNIIIEQILKNDSNKELIVNLKILQDEEVRLFLKEEDRWIGLSKIKSYSKENNGGKFFKFFVSLLSLYSDLCLDRNHRAINLLEPILDFKIIFNCIVNNDLSFKLRGVFAKIILVIWIDINPYFEENIPSKIIIRNNNLRLKEERNKKIDKIIEFILNYIIIETQLNFDLIKFINILLNIIKKILILGIIIDYTELNNIIDSWIFLLKSLDNFKNFTKLKIKQKNLIYELYITIIEILIIIENYNIDLKIFYFIKNDYTNLKASIIDDNIIKSTGKYLIKCLLKVFLFNNIQLKEYSLSLLFKKIMKSLEFYYNIKDILILEKSNDILNYKKLIETKKKFLKILENIDIWKQEEQINELENLINNLRTYLTEINNYRIVSFIESFGEEDINILSIINHESVDIDLQKQIIIDKLGFIELLIGIIKIIDINISKNIVYLLYLIIKNKENNYDFEFLKFFINLFKKNFEIHEIILLIDEVIKNNESLKISKKLFVDLINELWFLYDEGLIDKEKTNYKFFIYYLLQNLYFNNKVIIVKNQDYILNYFIENFENDLVKYLKLIKEENKKYFEKKLNGKSYFYLSINYNIVYLIFQNILYLIKGNNNYCIQVLNTILPLDKLLKLFYAYDNNNFNVVIIKNILLKLIIKTFNFNDIKFNINLNEYFVLWTSYIDNLEEIFSMISSFKNQNLIIINFLIFDENKFYIKFIKLGIKLIKKLIDKIDSNRNNLNNYPIFVENISKLLELIILNYNFLIDYTKDFLNEFIEYLLDLKINIKNKISLKKEYKKLNENIIKNENLINKNDMTNNSSKDEPEEIKNKINDNQINLAYKDNINISNINLKNLELIEIFSQEKKKFFLLLDEDKNFDSNLFIIELIKFSFKNQKLLFENITLIYDRFRDNKINKEIEIKIIELICELFSKKLKNSILIKIIKLGIELLEKRGEKLQEIFYNIFIKDSKMNFLKSLEKIILKSLSLFINFWDKMNRQKIESYLNNQNDNENNKKYIYKKNKLIELTTLIFRFLQLLCEGHNEKLQNYLLNQKNIYNVNFILISSSFFGKFSKNPQINFNLLIEQILDFMIESCQGPCELNQKCLIENKIIEFSGQLLNEINLINCKSNEWSNLFNKTINLLNSILEGNNNIELKFNMAKSINLEILLKSLYNQLVTNKIISRYIFKKKKNYLDLSSKLKIKIDDDLNDAFNIFFFIEYINLDLNYYKIQFDNIFANNPSLEFSYNFFKYNSAKIEILFKNNIENIFFIIQPPCRFLDENTKNVIVDKLNRNTPNEKITDLMNNVPYLIDEIVYLEILKNRLIGFSPTIFKNFRFLSIILSIIINILILTRNKVIVNNKYSESRGTLFDFDGWIFNYLGLIQLIASANLLIFWLYIFGPLSLMRKWRNFFNNLKKNVNKKKNNLIHEILDNPWSNIKKKQYIDILSDNNKKKKFLNLKYFAMNINFLWNDKIIIYWIVYFLASLIAYFYNFFFLYSFHLLDIINREERLLNVIKAITHNKRQLILTAILGIIIIYIYSSFAYFYIIDTFFNYDIGENGENMCSTLLQCFFVVLSLGPRSSGSIGDILIRQSFSYENQLRYWVRYIYDLSCFFIINVIFMNIIFGIIIDTFADLRDTKKSKEEDAENYCMICSIDRNTFDKEIINGFKIHIDEDHNPWNYLYFIYYLKIKENSEYNGIESYIFAKMEKDDISWFPILRSKNIKENNTKKSDNLEEKLELIHNQLNEINKQISLIKK